MQRAWRSRERLRNGRKETVPAFAAFLCSEGENRRHERDLELVPARAAELVAWVDTWLLADDAEPSALPSVTLVAEARRVLSLLGLAP